MAEELDERNLEQLFTWIDSIPLTRPKKDLKRDFSDGALVAEVVKYYYPNLVDLHNYPPAQSLNNKTANWNVLNRKVFRRLGFEVTDDLIQKLVQCKQWFIEQFLTLLRQILDKVNATDGDADDVHVLTNDDGDGFPAMKALSGVKLLEGVVPPVKQEPRAPRDAADKDKDASLLASLLDSITDLNARTCVEEKLQELDAKNDTIQVLQGKVRRAERLLQQRELRVAELQLRCRRLEKEKATRGKELVNKMPYYQHHQPQQQPQEPELEHKEQPEQKPEPELKEEQQQQSVVNKLA